MTRAANRKQSREAPGQEFCFLPHEFARLKHNVPGPSGDMGGYQGLENIVIDATDKITLACKLDAITFERLVRYIRKYGGGGPNKRLRIACIPALRRAGIDLLPEWSV